MFSFFSYDNIPINVGAVIYDSMCKARVQKSARFSFGGLLTILKNNRIEEEPDDHKLPQNPKRVDIMKVKDFSTS